MKCTDIVQFPNTSQPSELHWLDDVVFLNGPITDDLGMQATTMNERREGRLFSCDRPFGELLPANQPPKHKASVGRNIQVSLMA